MLLKDLKEKQNNQFKIILSLKNRFVLKISSPNTIRIKEMPMAWQ
jgi:hypothetical protein